MYFTLKKYTHIRRTFFVLFVLPMRTFAVLLRTFRVHLSLLNLPVWQHAMSVRLLLSRPVGPNHTRPCADLGVINSTITQGRQNKPVKTHFKPAEGRCGFKPETCKPAKTHCGFKPETCKPVIVIFRISKHPFLGIWALATTFFRNLGPSNHFF